MSSNLLSHLMLEKHAVKTPNELSSLDVSLSNERKSYGSLPEVQRKFLQDEALAITEEAIKGKFEGLSRHAELHSMSVSVASEE